MEDACNLKPQVRVLRWFRVRVSCGSLWCLPRSGWPRMKWATASSAISRLPFLHGAAGQRTGAMIGVLRFSRHTSPQSAEDDRTLPDDREIPLATENPRRPKTAVWSVLLLLAVGIALSAPGSVSADSSGPAALVPATSVPPTSIRLCGWVKDQMGNPIPSGVRVVDNNWEELGNVQTTADGTGSDGRERTG
jgi:hypothetical protein